MDFLKDYAKLDKEMGTKFGETSEMLFNRFDERKSLIEAAVANIKKNKHSKRKVMKDMDKLMVNLDNAGTLLTKDENKKHKNQTVHENDKENINIASTNNNLEINHTTKGAIPKTGRLTRASSRKPVNSPKKLLGDSYHNQKKNDVKSTLNKINDSKSSSKENVSDIKNDEIIVKSRRNKISQQPSMKRARSPSENTNNTKRTKTKDTAIIENSKLVKDMRNHGKLKPENIKIEQKSKSKKSSQAVKDEVTEIEAVALEKEVVIKLERLNETIFKHLINGGKIIYSQDSLIIKDETKIISTKEEKLKGIKEDYLMAKGKMNKIKTAKAEKVPVEEKDSLKMKSKTTLIKEKRQLNEDSPKVLIKAEKTLYKEKDSLMKNKTNLIKEKVQCSTDNLKISGNSIIKNKTISKINITNTPVQTITRTKKKNLLAKGIFETVFETPVKTKEDNDIFINNKTDTIAFMPVAVSTEKINRIMPSTIPKTTTNETILECERLESTNKQEEEKSVKQLAKERERMLLQKQKEDAKKRLLLAKEKSDKRKLAEKLRLAEETKLKDNKLKQTQPIYKTEKAPPLPTFDCYDSDDPERNKVDFASNRPEWSKGAALLGTLQTMTLIDDKLKNTLFCPAPSTPDLQEIFENIDPSKLRRNSSAIWLNQSKLQLTLQSIPDLEEV